MARKEEQLSGERLELRYVPLETAVRWEDNPKRHDMGGITASIARNGFLDPPKFDATLGALIYGNGRTHGLRLMRDEGQKPPRGILVDAAGAWYVPVMFGVDAESQSAAVAFAIDHNNLTMAGGDFGPNDLLRMYDELAYKKVLRDLVAEDVFPVTVDGEDLGALFALPPEPAEAAKLDTSPRLDGMIYQVVVVCRDEDHQTQLLERFRREELECKPLIS